MLNKQDCLQLATTLDMLEAGYSLDIILDNLGFDNIEKFDGSLNTWSLKLKSMAAKMSDTSPRSIEPSANELTEMNKVIIF